ncbi:MAG: ABC transporter permease subunit [Microbacteriaceae bacterium]|nr:ABC transporter permease subunit [Microbacteriaceae bacterium]
MQWLWENRDLVLGLSLDHVQLSAVPIIVGFIACIPLGWMANRFRVTRAIQLALFGILFTIPSLALFVTLPSVLGTKILNPINVVVALTIYAIAIMVRGAADAFASVSRDVIQSSTAVGFSSVSRFWTVEFPLAGPVLLANLRVVSVTTVSLLSVGALVGNGALGYLFINGYQRDFPTEVMIGIVFTLIIAIVFDQLLVAIGKMLMPWTRGEKYFARTALVRSAA